MAFPVITTFLFCNGPFVLRWDSFLRACCSAQAFAVAKVLIERSNMSHVQLKMSRVKVILVVVMPALFLLVSGDCFGDLTTGRRCNSPRCLLSHESGKHKAASADNSFESTLQRCRRVNVQHGTDGFGAPVFLAQSTIMPEQTISSFISLPASLERIQSWQFLWRTALEPRAPSLVS